MSRLLILIAVLGIGLILWHKISKAKGEERKKLMFWSIIGGVGAILLLLAVTGHLNIITAAIAGLVALLPRAMQLLRFLPFISKFYKQHGPQTGAQHGQPGGQSAPPRGKQTMSKEQAIEILNLKADYSKKDVIASHRRMMQKVHPDRGGSDYLAAQINQAKDTLLG